MSMTWERLGSMLLEETGNTLLMTLPATFFAYLIGLPLGVLLVITRKDGILPKPTLNRIIGVIVNLLRSVPFIILMVMLFPATRAILGRGTGTVSIIIPLTVSAFPYVARMVESSRAACWKWTTAWWKLHRRWVRQPSRLCGRC